jgi:outer membrane protein
VTQAWGQLEAAKAQIDATTSQVTAAEVALNGVREEARACVLYSAGGNRRASAQILGPGIQVYDPVPHYHQVRDAWGGVRVPDGR